MMSIPRLVALSVGLSAFFLGLYFFHFQREESTAYRFNSIPSLVALSVGLSAFFLGLYFFHFQREESTAYRFNSFAPVRDGQTSAKWFVDGEDYMSSVADAILAAKREIFITDWQMSPFIFLKRPENGVTDLEWRLDKVLLKKADMGVHIYILLYWETKLAMDLGSDVVLDVLKHDKITILRHPTYSTPIKHPTTLLRWSHHEKVVVIDRKIAFVGGIDLAFGRWDTNSHLLADNYPLHPCLRNEKSCGHQEQSDDDADQPSATKRYRRWIGKDYGNTFLGGARTGLDDPLEDYIDRNMIPRMPWHDVACAFDGAAASDVAYYFIQRYNSITNQQSWWKFWDWKKQIVATKIWKSKFDWKSTFDDINVRHKIKNPSSNRLKIQVLTSTDAWSAEDMPHQDSIHQAYLHAIENSEHLIYIENQFFISSQPEDALRRVKNQIQDALAKRIIKAYENFEDFHVVIILPLQPEFPGEWGTESGKDLADVSYWNYATLYTGDHSLFAKLKKGNIPESLIHRYFSCYGLRTHDIWPGNKFVTEIIYVHSKLMIVDDRLAIVGSANINDRSMLGSRDSEVNVIIEDKEMIDGTMNGKSFSVGKFSHELRCHLMKEHLGLLEEKHYPDSINLDVRDPLKFDFYTQLNKIASSNTNIYEKVFRRKILPTDQVKNIEDLKKWKTFEGLADESPEKANIELSKIRGRLVLFPGLFLKDYLKPMIRDYSVIVMSKVVRVDSSPKIDCNDDSLYTHYAYSN